MLLSLLPIALTTLFCSGIGSLFLRLLRFVSPGLSVPALLLPFLGLLVSGVLAGIGSLFFPLGHPALGLLIAAGALLRAGILLRGNGTKSRLLPRAAGSFGALWLAGCGLLLVLGSSRWEHPDTLAYHVETMRWIGQYPVIKGLAQLNPRLGYQGLWYQLCALFSFPFLRSSLPTFLPLTFALWCFTYVVAQAERARRQPASGFTSLAWLILTAWIFWDFNALRLTAGSAGNDFPAATFAWLAFHLASRKDHHTQLLPIAGCAAMAVAIKLSALPVLLLPVYIALKDGRRIIQLGIFAGTAACFLAPVLIRNTLTTGYPLYPSPAGALLHTDWQLPRPRVEAEIRYITAWARHPGVQQGGGVDEVMAQPLSRWLPDWWRARSVSERALIALLMCALPAGIAKLRGGNGHARTLFAIAVFGTLSWWLQAPDPRFGMSFTIPMIAMAICLWEPAALRGIGRTQLVAAVMALALAGYAAYRLRSFFEPAQLLSPAGVQDIPFERAPCSGQWFYRPAGPGNTEGPIPVPALRIPCDSFRLRGARIEDGFRSP